MQYIYPTTEVFIKEEPIPLPPEITWAYNQWLNEPSKFFIYVWRVGNIYYNISISQYYGDTNFYVFVGVHLKSEGKLHRFHNEMMKNWEDLEKGNRELTIRLVRWMCKYIKEKDLPYIVQVSPELKPYLIYFLKIRGLEAIQIPSKKGSINLRFRIIEQDVMSQLYEGLI